MSEYSGIIAGKRIGIVTNQTGITSGGVHIVDHLSALENVNIKAVFGPEHGFRGDKADAIRVASYTDERTGLKVWSLYGRNFKPTPEMLEDIDVLIYDIQDIGARFYTFISTMGLCMEAAAENGKQFIVLDRPNPITGEIIEGPLIEEKHFSFVGKFPIPIRYGMTPGELAQMIKGEGWMNDMENLDLKVVPLKGWERDMWFDETGLPWINPSPNIPSLMSATVYPGMCLFEAVNISEGRGTLTPFEVFGAPWIENIILSDRMNDLDLPGVFYTPVFYTPASITNVSPRSKYLDETVYGLKLVITDRDIFRPVDSMVHLFTVLKELYPEKFEFRTNLERLIGASSFRSMINRKREPGEILEEWDSGIPEFSKARGKYLIYR
ncbi:MAG: DUF1343 domain-containing protein [bacterium]|nr:DUF1343 domain-containing protein [bacterium]